MGKQHPDKALSALKVKHLTIPGRYADGNGLYLVVDPSGAKRWLLRVVVQGKRTDIGLGGISIVPLAEARERALEYRKIARSGGDPLAVKRAAKQAVLSFREAAKKVHEEHKTSWKNEKHAQQWINTLTQYAFPLIGDARIDRIATPDILRVLAPIWLTKPETARRVRQRLGSVFDWAKVAGHRTGDNPIEGVTRGLPKQTDSDNHHKAMPFTEVPKFVITLRTSNSGEVVKLALEFLILTATRTSETLLAQKSEFDLSANVWTIPADRMKANRLHRIPLSGRAVEIAEQAIEFSGESVYLFPGRSEKKPLSNMVFLEMLKRMEIPVTPHGFRSSFRDWSSETTEFPRELAEMALAHTIGNKVEAAYRRGDLLEKRREMMQAWQNHICPSAVEGGDHD